MHIKHTILGLAAAAMCAETAMSDDAMIKRVGAGNNEFGCKLYSRLAKQEGNLFFSPASISTALAMTFAGARGTTAEQMAATLCFPTGDESLHEAYDGLMSQLNKGDDRPFELVIANALWGQKGFGFLDSFLKLNKQYYEAGLNSMDFGGAPEACRGEINAWVEAKTRDRIKDLLPQGSINAMTRLVLTNAVYFKGDWEHPFKRKATRNAAFYTGKEDVQAPLMQQKERLGYFESPALQVLVMPYGGNELEMAVFLPRQKDGLAGLETELTSATMDDWMRRARPREVRVFLPRFTSTSQFVLEKTLGAMGMPAAFSDGADFSGMTGRRDLCISSVVHKAFVDVNEEGTEAAAATGVVMRLTAAMPQPVPVFRADHPFVYVIRHRPSGTILFMGRLADPRSGG